MLRSQGYLRVKEAAKLLGVAPNNRGDGEHRVPVVLNEPPAVDAGVAETPVRWENGVLVYAGEVLGPIEHAVEDSREERIRHLLAGCQPDSDK